MGPLLLHMDAAEAAGCLPDRSVKLVYGSAVYPNVRRDYGTWDGPAWLDLMKRHLTALVPKVRTDGFIAINVKAGREYGQPGQHSYRRRWVERLLIWIEDSLPWWAVDDEIWSKVNGVPRGPRCCASDAWEPVYLWAGCNPWRLNLDAIRQPYAPSTLERYQRDYRPNLSGVPVYHRVKQVRPSGRGAYPKNVIAAAVGGPRGHYGHSSRQPEELPLRYILACTDPGDLVWDPWMGSGTTPAVAHRLGRRCGGSDVIAHTVQMVRHRLEDEAAACVLHV